MASAVRVCGHRKPTFCIHVVLWASVITAYTLSLPSLTKQETQPVGGGKGAIKFYEGLKLHSVFVETGNGDQWGNKGGDLVSLS